ncbi:glycosyltransferase family 4 protein [Daejeonella sp.]|uniref:glycosyltransferase family 4 protein n=1 Tax=Daejeonella sp. TaxID=2805397 RepID=UPI0030BCC993
MKIGVLSPVAWRTPPRHYGPWEQMASNITEGLVASGMDVTLFATSDSLTSGTLDSVVASGYEEDRELDAKVVECLHISNFMEKAGDFDILHNHYDFLPLSYSRLIKTPIITTIHGFSSPKIIPVYKKYNDSSTYVSISNSNRSQELEYLATVYNGIRTADFTFVASPDDYLLFFGRIHPDKGALEAIQIARNTSRKLIIAGIVQDERYFTEKIEPEFDDQIVFVGHAGPDARNKLLGKATVLLHPINFDEPFGLSVAEAMYCGTPVIAFNRGSMPELIKDGKTGYLVKDVESGSDAVSDLKSIDRHLCHTWAKDNFSSEKMVSDYLTLYKQIIQR